MNKQSKKLKFVNFLGNYSLAFISHSMKFTSKLQQKITQ